MASKEPTPQKKTQPARPDSSTLVKGQAEVQGRKLVSSPGKAAQLLGSASGETKAVAGVPSVPSAKVASAGTTQSAGAGATAGPPATTVSKGPTSPPIKMPTTPITPAPTKTNEPPVPTTTQRPLVPPLLSSGAPLSNPGLSLGLPSLESATPILLLPFRLETRFVKTATGTELWLRVYPDQISIDSHQEALSPVEATAGAVYWNQAWNLAQTPGNDPAGPWRTIAANFNPQRAAWIVKQMYPSNWPSPLPATGMVGLAVPVPPNPPGMATAAQTGPIAACLPDRWTAFLYPTVGPPLEFQFPNPVTQDLAVAPDPASEITISSAGATLPAAMQWMINFDDAVTAGMAARLQLTDPSMLTSGIARIVILGLRASSVNSDGSSILEPLFDAHHYSDGLSFIPQGAPTKNTPTASSAYSRMDPGFNTSYSTELGSPLATPDSSSGGALLASTLGLPTSLFDHVRYADRTERSSSSAMLTALWPATLGYYLTQMIGIKPTTVEAARQFAVNHVFARGPYPSLQVGIVPYGILPVTSLELLADNPRRLMDPFAEGLLPVVKSCLSVWQQSVGGVPRVGGTGDPNGSLLGVLGMAADPVSYNFRSVMGPQFMQNYEAFEGLAHNFWVLWDEAISANGRKLLAKLGYPNATPMILGTGQCLLTSPITIATVYDGSPATSETQSLPNVYPVSAYLSSWNITTETNYLGWLAGADLDDVTNQSLDPIPSALLYVLTRHSLIRLAADLGTSAAIKANIIVNNQPATASSAKEAELVNFPSQPATQRASDFLASTIPGVTAPGQSYKKFLRDVHSIPRVPQEWIDMVTSLVSLSALPTAELDRLLSETLAATGSRIDPWVTGLVHALLPTTTSSPVNVGGYGWIENLTPNPPNSALTGAEETAPIAELITGLSKRRGVTLPTPTVYQAPADNAGYIHAPSLAQGATAAILRNGFVSQLASSPGTASGPLTIDLSSHRIRSALKLLDGLRAGDSLAALIGYQFEMLMQAVAPTDPLLTAQIQTFEAAYPLVANKLTTPPGPASKVAAPNVVDGVSLLADYQANAPAFQQLVNQLPPSSLADFNELMEQLQDGLTALEDLFTAETVHQIQLGNTVRSGATLDSVENGETPPEIQVVQSPQSGTANTHRVALLFPGPPATSTGKPGDQKPRAAAESWLHVWLRGLIPDPANVTCQYSIGPPSSAPGAPPLQSVTLDLLGAGPLDFLAMNSADVTTPQLSELEARILDYIYNVSASPPPQGSAPVTLVYTRAASWSSTILSVPEYLVVLRAFSDLLSGSRALGPVDLSPPPTGRTIPGVGVAGTDVVQRATNASTALELAITDLQTARSSLWTSLQTPGSNPTAVGVQQALRAASWFNLPHAIPADPTQARRLVPAATIAVGSTVATAVTGANLSFALGSTDALAGGTGQMTIWTTPGTILSNNPADYVINGTPVTANPVTDGNAVQLTVPVSISASSKVTVSMSNLTNPPALSGAITASVLTSGGSYASADGDSLLVALGSIAQADLVTVGFASGFPGLPTAVSNVGATFAGPAPLSMAVNFVTGPHGTLAAGAGTISISGPGGTLFSSSPNDYQIQVSPSATPISLNAAPKVTGSAVTITVPANIPSANGVTVLINNLSGTLPSTAQFSVWTSSDTMPTAGITSVSVPGTSGGSSVSSPTVAEDPVSATYTVKFQTNKGLTEGSDTVTLWGPNGMSFSSHGSDYLFSKASNPIAIAALTDPQVNPGQVTIVVPEDIAPNEGVTLVMQSVQGPGAGSYAISLATSEDTLAVVAPFSVPLGAADAIATLRAVFGRSFLALPSFVPSNVSDLVAAFSASSSLTSSDGDAVARWVQQLTHVHPAIQRLDHAMGLAQVTAGAPAPSFMIGQLPVLPNDQWLSLPSRSSVAAGEVTVDNPASGGAAQYTIGFTTSPSGSLSGTDNDWLVITAPSGTTLPAGGYSLEGLAAGAVPLGNITLGTFGGSATQNQAMIALGPTASVPAGDLLTLVVAGVDNPSSASDGYQILIYTSGDSQAAATATYTITGNDAATSVPVYTPGRLDMVIIAPGGFDPMTLSTTSTPLYGLWIDGWSERIPSLTETTGLAFHYEEPLTQAPQCLLLAVNPTNSKTWTEDGGLSTLRTIVEETLEMAKVRAVDDLIRVDGGEFLPAIYCAFNPLGDTPSIDFKAIEPWFTKAVVTANGEAGQ